MNRFGTVNGVAAAKKRDRNCKKRNGKSADSVRCVVSELHGSFCSIRKLHDLETECICTEH